MPVRQDFRPQTQLPPRLFLEQVMDTVSKVYCFIWDRRDDENRVEMTWKDLTLYYNKNSFRTNLRKLVAEGLVSYEETPEGLSIEVVGWDEVAEG